MVVALDQARRKAALRRLRERSRRGWPTTFVGRPTFVRLISAPSLIESYEGTSTNSACRNFVQLGVDLRPNVFAQNNVITDN